MTKKLYTVGLSLVVMCISIPAHAERPSINALQTQVNQLNAQVNALESEVNSLRPKQFVGFSESTVKGDAGYPAINQACRNSFGTGARICMADEVISTIQPPVSTTIPYAWVRGDNAAANTLRIGFSEAWNCNSFKSESGHDAYVVSAATGEIIELDTGNSDPRYYVIGTCADSYAIACCQ